MARIPHSIASPIRSHPPFDRILPSRTSRLLLLAPFWLQLHLPHGTVRVLSTPNRELPSQGYRRGARKPPSPGNATAPQLWGGGRVLICWALLFRRREYGPLIVGSSRRWATERPTTARVFTRDPFRAVGTSRAWQSLKWRVRIRVSDPSCGQNRGGHIPTEGPKEGPSEICKKDTPCGANRPLYRFLCIPER